MVNPGGSQGPHGELLRAKRGAVPEEDVSDRGKPLSSRGAVEAVSIHGASRKPTCNGGGVTSGVTRRQSRSRAGSETASGARVSKKHQRPGARVKYPFLVYARPAEAGPARRETTDPSIAPLARADQAGRKPRARVQVRQVVVGRSRSDTSRTSRGNREALARGRSAWR